MRVGPFAFRYQRNGATPCHYVDTTRKAIDCAATLPLSFYIMKLCSRLFVLYCRNCPKDDKFRKFTNFTTRKAIDCATTAAERFYIMKLCSRIFVLYCRNCPKYDTFRYFIPILRKWGGVESWLMARWKARVEFLLSAIELLFTARRIASAALVTAIPSVCPSVRLSVRHTPVLCQSDGT